VADWLTNPRLYRGTRGTRTAD